MLRDHPSGDYRYMPGISAFSWLAVKLRWGVLPTGVRWGQMVGLAALAGIGFTVSLFVADLAFDGTNELADAKVGILLASLVAAAFGSILLTATATSRDRDEGQTRPTSGGMSVGT